MFKNFKYLSSLNEHGVILNKHAAATPVQILNIFLSQQNILQHGV